MTTQLYTESGISLNLSDYAHFRFEDCQGYHKIKGLYVKEIDFGWWNDREECLYLLEIKNFIAEPDRIKVEEKSEKLIDDLSKKSIDVLLMLSAIWLENSGSQEIKSCLPTQTQRKCKMKIFHLIRCDKSTEPFLHALNDKLKKRFCGYKQLYENLLTFTIISDRQAKEIFREILFV